MTDISRAEKDLLAIINEDPSILDQMPQSRLEELLILLYDKINNNSDHSITVDSELSDTSENPVQNKAIKAAIARILTSLDLKADISDPVFTGSFSQGRKANTIIGDHSHAEGTSSNSATAIMTDLSKSSTSDDILTAWKTNKFSLAHGENSHVEGQDSLALGKSSHAQGYQCRANGDYSYAQGYQCKAEGDNAIAEGMVVTAAENAHATGYHLDALEHQSVCGHMNNTTTATKGYPNGTSGTAFVVGNGDALSRSKSNAFRITYNGEIFAKSATVSTGADYAEFFEWEDGNPEKEDRRGYFVTLNNNKIKLAQPEDYILGVISGFPSIIGNGDEEWMGRYVFDDFGTPVIEEFEYEDPITGEKMTCTKWKENPDYDNEKPYIQRRERQEWDAVGMLGVLHVRDDGTCVPNKYCKITDGSIATLSENKSDYRVIRRVNDNIVEIVFR